VAVNGFPPGSKYSVVELDPYNPTWKNGYQGCPAIGFAGGVTAIFEGSLHTNSACPASAGAPRPSTAVGDHPVPPAAGHTWSAYSSNLIMDPPPTLAHVRSPIRWRLVAPRTATGWAPSARPTTSRAPRSTSSAAARSSTRHIPGGIDLGSGRSQSWPRRLRDERRSLTCRLAPRSTPSEQPTGWRDSLADGTGRAGLPRTAARRSYLQLLVNVKVGRFRQCHHRCGRTKSAAAYAVQQRHDAECGATSSSGRQTPAPRHHASARGCCKAAAAGRPEPTPPAPDKHGRLIGRQRQRRST
jgi:hypothetical protein